MVILHFHMTGTRAALCSLRWQRESQLLPPCWSNAILISAASPTHVTLHSSRALLTFRKWHQLPKVCCKNSWAWECPNSYVSLYLPPCILNKLLKSACLSLEGPYPTLSFAFGLWSVFRFKSCPNNAFIHTFSRDRRHHFYFLYLPSLAVYVLMHKGDMYCLCADWVVF